MRVRESQSTVLRFVEVQAAELGMMAERLLPQDREVHVYAFSLAAPREVVRWCRQWLSRAELYRAIRFRFAQDRRSYLVAHGYLRYLLGGYCGKDPGALEFHHGLGGKPQLSGLQGKTTSIRFNLTHSHGFGLVAVASGIEVGVDLEKVREGVNHMMLAKRFFSPREWQAISAKEGESQRIEFFRYWVGKEAILKAKGTGLRFPLAECELSFAENNLGLVRWNSKDEKSNSFSCARFIPLEQGWVGAVAAEGTDWTVVGPGSV